MTKADMKTSSLFPFPFSLVPLLALVSCQSVETVTTKTAPDGTVTQTVQRPMIDPFDAALADAAAQLMTLQGGFAP